MKRMKIGVVVGLALVMLLNCAVQAQLVQVPPDTLVVFQVNNLKAVNDKLAKFAQDLGIAAMFPPAADPLGFLQMQAHIQQGLDTAGNLAWVMVDPDKVGGDPSEAMLILVPVTDYKAFLSNWPDATADGDVSAIKFAGDPQPVNVANWGKYAAISPNKKLVTEKPSAGLVVPPITSREIAAKDAILYANMVALRSKVGPELAKTRPEMIQSLEAALNRNPQATKFTAVIKVVVNQALNGVERCLNDADAATFGLALTSEGINTTLMGEFQPTSYMGKIASSLTNTSESYLGGLPKGKYLAYGGGVHSPAVLSQLLTDIGDPIVKELLAVGPEMAPVQDYYTAVKSAVASAKNGTVGVLAPSGALGTESIMQVIAINRGDAAKMIEANTKMLTVQQQLMKAIGAPGMETMKMTYTPNAKTVAGVTFNTLATTIEMNPQNPVSMQQAQVFNMMYGPQGQVIQFGVVGNDIMLTAIGLNDTTLAATVAAAKANTNPFEASDGYKAVVSQLPRQHIVAYYLAVGDFATTVLSYAKQFGLALPVQLPPDLPPIGVAVASEGSALRIDTHVPTTLVQSLVAAGLQAQMQMNGGAPGAMPPGGGL
ncbi:MAG TPA: hypothetical protein VHD56_00295 [Tepidisphaeraceae bacterium]|nr:hypothetical protein [Tepidisphaeraceae bacterium]